MAKPKSAELSASLPPPLEPSKIDQGWLVMLEGTESEGITSEVGLKQLNTKIQELIREIIDKILNVRPITATLRIRLEGKKEGTHNKFKKIDNQLLPEIRKICNSNTQIADLFAQLKDAFQQRDAMLKKDQKVKAS